MNLFIFSDDLRTKDNRALFEASLDQKGLVALFIIDKTKNKDHGDSLAKLKLKLLGLEKISKSLISLNISLKILYSKKISDEPGDILEQGDEPVSIESVKAVAGVNIPFDCELLENNEVHIDNLDHLNDNPECEENSWIIKVKKQE